ncbi:MAG: DUF2158 domain-containing protein [Pseudomonadota bacterium]
MKDFQIGGIVRLKSGGLNMTIENPSYHPNPDYPDQPYEVWCVWFDGTELQYGSFLPEVLERIED